MVRIMLLIRLEEDDRFCLGTVMNIATSPFVGMIIALKMGGVLYQKEVLSVICTPDEEFPMVIVSPSSPEDLKQLEDGEVWTWFHPPPFQQISRPAGI